MAYRYKSLWIPMYIKKAVPGFWKPDELEENPEHKAIREGAYLPPEGSRVVSAHWYNEGSKNQIGWMLMLEFEFAEGNPYR